MKVVTKIIRFKNRKQENPPTAASRLGKGGKRLKGFGAFDSKGELVTETISDQNNLYIDASSWSAGIYYLKIISNEQVVMRKWVKP